MGGTRRHRRWRKKRIRPFEEGALARSRTGRRDLASRPVVPEPGRSTSCSIGQGARQGDLEESNSSSRDCLKEQEGSSTIPGESRKSRGVFGPSGVGESCPGESFRVGTKGPSSQPRMLTPWPHPCGQPLPGGNSGLVGSGQWRGIASCMHHWVGTKDISMTDRNRTRQLLLRKLGPTGDTGKVNLAVSTNVKILIDCVGVGHARPGLLLARGL
jgi:hypothetical protein